MAYGLWFYLLEMVAKEGKDCILTLERLSFEDISKDTNLEVKKIKEIIEEMTDITLIDKERYKKEKVLFIPQFIHYFDDYTERVRREYGECSDKVVKNRREYRRIEESILDIWNKTTLPKILTFSEERKRRLRYRIKNQHFVDNYTAAIEKVAQSKFCCGGDNGDGWKATIDWFINNDTNYVKALEGKYDERISQNPLQNYDKLLEKAGLKK